VVTVNEPAAPTVKSALLALVIAGGVFTVSVKLCVALGGMPLFAVMTIGKMPPVVGVPARVAVPLLLFTKVTPAGSAPVCVMTIAAPLGTPVVVTVNVPAWLSVNVVLLALVMAGDWFTVIATVALADSGVPVPVLPGR
jgi:hypothetical protein